MKFNCKLIFYFNFFNLNYFLFAENILNTKIFSFKERFKLYSHKEFLKKEYNFDELDNIKIYGYSDNLELSKPFLNSAKKFRIPITDLFYSDYNCNVYMKKFYALRFVIDDLADDILIVFTDIFDVLFVNDIDFIKNKFLSLDCDLVIGAESVYSHQSCKLQSFYDNFFKNNSIRYLNLGFIMGYCWIIKIMLDLCIDWFQNNEYSDTNGYYSEQTMSGVFFFKYHNVYKLKLDINRSIVWNIVPKEYIEYSDVSYKNGNFFLKDNEIGLVHIPGKNFVWGETGSFIFNDIQEKTY